MIPKQQTLGYTGNILEMHNKCKEYELKYPRNMQANIQEISINVCSAHNIGNSPRNKILFSNL